MKMNTFSIKPTSLLLAALLASSGCQTTSKSISKTPALEFPAKKVSSDSAVKDFESQTGMNIHFETAQESIPQNYQSYEIGPGDELEILVERFEAFEENETLEISSDFIEKFAGMVFTRYKVTVDPLGDIQIPLVGELRAADQSRQEIEAAIKERLGRFLVDPKVFVKVAAYTSYSVSVLGKVGKPGRYEIKRPVSLSEALAMAGGITNEGTMSKIYVARRSERSRKFNITEIWSKAGVDQELVLGRDDIVFVPHKVWITWTTAEQIATVIDLLTNAYYRYKDNKPI